MFHKRLKSTLFTLMLAVTILVTVMALITSAPNNQSLLISRVRSAGGTVVFDFERNSIALGEVGFRSNDRGLSRYLFGDEAVDRIALLDLGRSQVTDDELRLLACGEVEAMWLNDTQISDSGIAYLRKMHTLKELRIERSQISDQAVAYLLELKDLRRLWVSESNLSALGVSKLRASLPNCQIAAYSVEDDRMFGTR